MLFLIVKLRPGFYETMMFSEGMTKFSLSTTVLKSVHFKYRYRMEARFSTDFTLLLEILSLLSRQEPITKEN